MKRIGEGSPCSSKSDVTGELVYIKVIEDVIKLFDKAAGKICLVDDAGITTLSPILPELSGIICTTGSGGSHLAIVSREFGLPCIMATKFFVDDVSSLNGKKVKIVHEGDYKGVLYLNE